MTIWQHVINWEEEPKKIKKWLLNIIPWQVCSPHALLVPPQFSDRRGHFSFSLCFRLQPSVEPEKGTKRSDLGIFVFFNSVSYSFLAEEHHPLPGFVN